VTPFSYAFSAAIENEFEDTTDSWWLDAVGVAWRSKWGNLLVLLGFGLLWRAFGLYVVMRTSGPGQATNARVRPSQYDLAVVAVDGNGLGNGDFHPELGPDSANPKFVWVKNGAPPATSAAAAGNAKNLPV
jgi:hypothetical protein